MVDYVGFSLAFLEVLSLIGSHLILFYLATTESHAPQFIDSIRYLDPVISKESMPKLSVIVTARNEEKMIEDCLRSLLGQTYSNLEIFAVDDSSTDSTPQILAKFANEDSRIHAVSAGKKPEGWVGKTWPCWRGFEESSGEILLFVDADSTFRNDLLDLCV